MVFTQDDYLPSYEELTVPEITMTAAPLKAGAIYFGKYCDDICKVRLISNKYCILLFQDLCNHDVVRCGMPRNPRNL